MDWTTLKTLMLQEPKPSMSFVINQRGPITTRTARVLHDGDAKWLIWSSEKLEINNGERVIIAADGNVRVHDRSVYSHGWVKSIVHPRLTNIGDEDSFVEGRDVREGKTAGLDCWQVEIAGLQEGEPTTFTVDVEKESGAIIRLRRADVDAHLDVEELRIGVPVAYEVFEWARQFGPDTAGQP